jgi:hypothetical protein
MGGGANPPRFFLSHERIEEARRAALAARAWPVVPSASPPAVLQPEVVSSGNEILAYFEMKAKVAA